MRERVPFSASRAPSGSPSPSSADNPRPKPLGPWDLVPWPRCRVSSAMLFPFCGSGRQWVGNPRPLALDQLAGELDVGLASRAAEIIDKSRKTMARSLGDTNVTWDNRLINLVSEGGTDIGSPLVR